MCLNLYIYKIWTQYFYNGLCVIILKVKGTIAHFTEKDGLHNKLLCFWLKVGVPLAFSSKKLSLLLDEVCALILKAKQGLTKHCFYKLKPKGPRAAVLLKHSNAKLVLNAIWKYVALTFFRKLEIRVVLSSSLYNLLVPQIRREFQMTDIQYQVCVGLTDLYFSQGDVRDSLILFEVILTN